jgi:hypothetical protein
MALLNFEKPAKVTVEAGFDGAYTDGGFTPQMSDADAHRWKAKKFNVGKDGGRIELRKSFEPNSTQVHIIVALDGWDYAKKHEKRESNPAGRCFHTDTRGLNVRMSMNGPLLMTFDLWNEMNQLVQEARDYLENPPTQ